jgi:hypothetical protein
MFLKKGIVHAVPFARKIYHNMHLTQDRDEQEVKKLFSDLKSLDASNPYVCNLGMTIGMY